jgi:glutamate carboxypeptidase
MAPTEGNLRLLKNYSAVSMDLNQGPIKPLGPGMRGAGDISYVANTIPANLAGLGPMGIGTHSVIEAIQLNSLPIQTERAAILIYRLTH